jgi:hypothetical protein
MGRIVGELDEATEELRAVLVHAQAAYTANIKSDFYIASNDIGSRQWVA